jgi:hypothetical protein
MSNYEGYLVEDNVRRKMNNTGDAVESVGPNKNVKSYSSKPGQMTASQQAQHIAKVCEKLNRSQECKHFTKEEIDRLNLERGLVKPKAQPVEIQAPPTFTVVQPKIEVSSEVKKQIEYMESLGFSLEQIIAILKMK